MKRSKEMRVAIEFAKVVDKMCIDYNKELLRITPFKIKPVSRVDVTRDIAFKIRRGKLISNNDINIKKKRIRI